MIKKPISVFLACVLMTPLSQVFAVPPHSEPPSPEEQCLKNSICGELTKKAPSSSFSWLWSWFLGETETLDLENAPFKDYFTFFYTIYTAINRSDYGERLDTRDVAAKADAELRAIIHATKLPEELSSPEKLKECSEHIERIKSIFLRSLDDVECGHWQELKLQLLDEVKSFLENFSVYLSKDKIGFRELKNNYDDEKNYGIASRANAPRLTELYFKRMEKAGRPRVLIVGNGRALSSKVFMDHLVACPDCMYDYYAGLYYHTMRSSPAAILGTQYRDDEYYGDSKYDYFLVDIDPKVRPDVCLDMENSDQVACLGKNQWDFVLFEGYGDRQAISLARMLLKSGGLILGDWWSGSRDCDEVFIGPFADSEGIFTAKGLGVIYRKS